MIRRLLIKYYVFLLRREIDDILKTGRKGKHEYMTALEWKLATLTDDRFKNLQVLRNPDYNFFGSKRYVFHNER